MSDLTRALDAVNYGDSPVYNTQTGAGGPTDSATTQRLRTPYSLIRPDIEAACRTGVYQQLCAQEIRAALSQAPRIVTRDPDTQERVNDRATTLGLWRQLGRAASCAQRQGVAGLFILSDDVHRPLSMPIQPGAGIRGFRVLQRWDIQPLDWHADIRSPRFGHPETLSMSMILDGQRQPATTTHCSRIILLRGEIPDRADVRATAVGDGWDDYGAPLLDAMRQALPLLLTLSRESSRLLQNMGVLSKTLSAEAMARYLDQYGGSTISDYLSDMRSKLSSAGVAVNMPGETLERMKAGADEYTPLEQAIYRIVGMTLGRPIEVLNGQPPPGLGDNAKGARLTWGTTVSARQENSLRGPADQAVRLLMSEAGAEKERAEVVFGDPIPASPMERAQIRQAHTTSDALAVQAGIAPAAHFSRRYDEAEWVEDLPPLDAAPDTAALEILRQELGQANQTAPNEEEPAAGVQDPNVSIEAEPLNGAQITAAKEILGSIVAGTLTPEAGRLLLEGIMPADRAAALVVAMRGARPETEVVAEEEAARARAVASAAADSLRVSLDGRTIADTLTDAEVPPWREAETKGEAESRFRRTMFAVPSGVAAEAAKVLRWREEHGDEVKGMTETGWRRARQLAEESQISGAELIEIAAFLERHEGNEEVPEGDRPWEDAGRVAWGGWGGDPAASWAPAKVAALREWEP